MPLTLPPQTPKRPPDPAATPAPDRGRSFLNRLFAGDFSYPTITPASPPIGTRSPAEHDALSRALGCRDLFVIDAADRAARERFVTDLIRSAAGRGERVLTISPDPAAVDRFAHDLAGGSDLKVVRALGLNEPAHRLPPALARLTSGALGPARAEQAKRAARDAVAEHETRVNRLVEAGNGVGRVRQWADRDAELAATMAACAARRDRVEATVRAEVNGHGLAEHRTARDTLAAARREKETALATARQQLTAADPAKKSGLLSRLFGTAKPTAPPVELTQKVHDLERELKEHAEREATAQAEHDAAAVRVAAEIEKHVAARRAEAEAEFAALAADREKLRAEFAAGCQVFVAAGVVPPAELTPAAAEQLEAALAAEHAERTRKLDEARAHADDLHRAGTDLARRFLAETVAVVTTPGGIDADPVFRATDATPAFDLVILDHAEELTDADFVHLSRLGGRWVLAGDVAGPDAPKPPVGANGSGVHPRPSRNGRHVEPTFVARIARLLDREAWGTEAGRLVCRMAHPTADRRRAVTREPVADHPHIEVHVVPDDAGTAQLAAIAFPPDTPAAVAREFLFRQLGEPHLRPCGDHHWHHAGDQLMACWPAAEVEAAEVGWVELHPGVREKVVGAGHAAFTAAVVFDPAAGWSPESAAAWLDEHLPPCSPSRVAVLPRTPVAAKTAAAV